MTSASAPLYDGHTKYDDGIFSPKCSELGVASKPMVREPNATRNKSPIESVLPINEPGRGNDTGVV